MFIFLGSMLWHNNADHNKWKSNLNNDPSLIFFFKKVTLWYISYEINTFLFYQSFPPTHMYITKAPFREKPGSKLSSVRKWYSSLALPI